MDWHFFSISVPMDSGKEMLWVGWEGGREKGKCQNQLALYVTGV